MDACGDRTGVLVYFYRQILPLIGELGKTIIHPLAPMNSDRAYLFNIIIATGVTGVLALSVKHLGESVGRLPAAIGINLILFAYLCLALILSLLNESSLLSMKANNEKMICLILFVLKKRFYWAVPGHGDFSWR